MGKVVSVSIKDEVWDLAKEKGIRWSEALEKGVFEIATEEVTIEKGEKVFQTTLKNELEQLKRANRTMQEHILNINERLE